MLALIVGNGALPRAVAEAQDVPPLVCALAGHAPDGLPPDITFRVEHLGSLLRRLKRAGITRICLCGKVDRPDISLKRLDWRTALILPRMLKALTLGDDGALRIVIALFEAGGFGVEAAHVAAPDLLPPAGVLTAAPGSARVTEDARAGDAAIAAMGRADLGQACLVRHGVVLATETETGTDALIAGQGQAGAVLYKAPKPDQDRRADLPTIGPDTARNAVAAGLSGLVIEAGGVMVLDLPVVLGILDAAGLFLWVRERPV